MATKRRSSARTLPVAGRAGKSRKGRRVSLRVLPSLIETAAASASKVRTAANPDSSMPPHAPAFSTEVLWNEMRKTHQLALADITELERAIEQVAQAKELVQDLNGRLQSAREEECTRISREIHDELGQALTGLKLDVGWLKRHLTESNPTLVNKLDSMTKLIDAASKSVQDIAMELRPAVLDQLGLVPAIEWRAREFEARTGVPCRLKCVLRQVRLDGERATTLFRIFQEIMTNIARHARASSVTITVQERTGRLVLEVTDDGKGISQSEMASPGALGLVGMRQRAALLGGQLTIVGAPGKGTTVTLICPSPIEARNN